MQALYRAAVWHASDQTRWHLVAVAIALQTETSANRLNIITTANFVQKTHNYIIYLLPAGCGRRSCHVEAPGAKDFCQAHPAALAAQQPRPRVELPNYCLDLHGIEG